MRKAEKTEKTFLVETASVADTEADGGACLRDLDGGLLIVGCILGSSLK